MRVAPANLVRTVDVGGSVARKFTPVAVYVRAQKRPGAREDLDDRNEATFLAGLRFCVNNLVVAIAEKRERVCTRMVLAVDDATPQWFYLLR
ncbi:MAG: hypothetical protein AAFN50_12190 [Pseudomonadota bacterium]